MIQVCVTRLESSCTYMPLPTHLTPPWLQEDTAGTGSPAGGKGRESRGRCSAPSSRQRQQRGSQSRLANTVERSNRRGHLSITSLLFHPSLPRCTDPQLTLPALSCT